MWLLIAGLALAAWLGWAAYAGAERGLDAGIGVLVAWPALLLLAALVTAPLAALAALALRIARAGRVEVEAPAAAADGDEITARTFPL
jgi:hypothetical protein